MFSVFANLIGKKEGEKEVGSVATLLYLQGESAITLHLSGYVGGEKALNSQAKQEGSACQAVAT